MRPRPLKHDLIAEHDDGDVVVRYPRAAHAEAAAAVEVVRALWPVVEAYLGARWGGRVRLELLAEARVSGANPAAATLRHSLRGLAERSPAPAGVLSYQLGQLLWYAAGREAEYRGPAPRTPDWLLQAALTPLTHAWSERERWSDHLARHVQRACRAAPLPEGALERQGDLPGALRALAASQSLARAQSLERRVPGWVPALLAALADDPQRSAVQALEVVSGCGIDVWRERFRDDLSAWRDADDEWRSGVVT